MEKSNFIYGLTKFWWIPLLTGLVFIGFGAWILGDPTQSLPILAYIFAWTIGVLGVCNIIYGFCNADSYHGYGYSLAAGCIEVIFAFFIAWMPREVIGTVFAYGTGIYILFMSIYSFFESYASSRNTEGNTGLFWLLVIFLLGSLFFSLWFILGPAGLAITGWIYLGIAFCCYGVYRIIFAFNVRRINRNIRNIER